MIRRGWIARRPAHAINLLKSTSIRKLIAATCRKFVRDKSTQFEHPAPDTACEAPRNCDRESRAPIRINRSMRGLPARNLAWYFGTSMAAADLFSAALRQ